VQPGGQVFALEPATYAFTKLSRNLDLNVKLPIRAFRLGLGTVERENWETEVSCSWPVDKGFERVSGQVLPNARVQKDRIDISVCLFFSRRRRCVSAGISVRVENQIGGLIQCVRIAFTQ